MEQIGERLIWYYIPFTTTPVPLGGLNPITILNTFFVMCALWVLLYLGARHFALKPGKAQVAVEMFVNTFDGLVASSLELDTRDQNRKFFALIASLFAFLLLANFMGVLPAPLFESPTADINTTLSLGIMGMAIATFCAIRVKGIVGWLEELAGPLWSQEAATPGALLAGKGSAIFFFPLNVIGELSKIVSISFRIFGNILGGGIIVIVVSHLTYHLLFPIGLNLFFNIFIGVIQAFVFTMLTLTYISTGIK